MWPTFGTLLAHFLTFPVIYSQHGIAGGVAGLNSLAGSTSTGGCPKIAQTFQARKKARFSLSGDTMPRKPGEKYTQQQARVKAREYNESRPERHRFYGTSQWRRLRDYYITRHPLCAECLRQGLTTPAVIVDHIIPIADGGAELDESNLQSLCAACHNRKHGG